MKKNILSCKDPVKVLSIYTFLILTIFLFLTMPITSARPMTKMLLDSIAQKEMHYDLKGIVVKGKIPQIVQSRDTAIINPSAYHIPEGAYLKDLVKRIPGLDYDETSGRLTFNGKNIREINVNGKIFFSSDTKTPIENLPVRFISRLKIYRKQTDRDKALGIRSGNEFYVLDLQTKKELNKTFMNSLAAGAGNQHKKNLELHSDYFESGGENLSFHFTSGNQYINDLYKGSINDNISLNLTHQFTKGLMLTGNVSYFRNKSGNETSVYQEQYLNESNTYSLSQNTVRQYNRSLNSSINVNWEMDKRTQFTLMANYGHNGNSSSSNGRNASVRTQIKNIDLLQPFSGFNHLADSLKINQNNLYSLSSAHGNNYSINASFIRRMNNKGAMISLNLQNSRDYTISHETNESNTIYYQLQNTTGNDSLFIQNLKRQIPSFTNRWAAGISFVQPLSKKIKLQLSYTYNRDKSQNTRHTFETPSDKLIYNPVDSLSGYSISHTSSHDIGLLFNYLSDKWNIYLDTNILPGTRSLSHHLYGEAADTLVRTMDFTTALHIERTQNNRTLAFDYNSNSSQPDLLSLIPLTDNSDPLNISRGNPGLSPTISHNWMLSYNELTKGISCNMSFNLIQNSVTRATFYNSRTGGRESYPVNINGNWGGSASARWWKTYGKFNITLMGNGTYHRSADLLSETGEMQHNLTQSVMAMSMFQGDYSPSWGGITLTGNYNYSYILNSSQKRGNYTHTLSSGINAFADLPAGIQLQSDFMYTLRTGDNIPASEKYQTLWNASLTWRFLKEKRMELSILWHDILNHSRMYFRTSSPTGFYESYAPQIRSYFMVSLKYRFQIIK